MLTGRQKQQHHHARSASFHQLPSAMKLATSAPSSSSSTQQPQTNNNNSSSNKLTSLRRHSYHPPPSSQFTSSTPLMIVRTQQNNLDTNSNLNDPFLYDSNTPDPNNPSLKLVLVKQLQLSTGHNSAAKEKIGSARSYRRNSTNSSTSDSSYYTLSGRNSERPKSASAASTRAKNLASGSSSHKLKTTNADSDMAVIYRANKNKNVVTENPDKMLTRKKYRSSVVSLELKLVEKLRELNEMVEADPYGEIKKVRTMRIYSELFDEIIDQSPFSNLLKQIKEAYEKDPMIPSSTDLRNCFEDIIVKYSRASIQVKAYRSQMEEMNKIIESLRLENAALKEMIKNSTEESKPSSKTEKSNSKSHSELLKQGSKQIMSFTSQKPTETYHQVDPSDNYEFKIAPFDFTGFKNPDDDSLVSLKYRERKHFLETELMKSKLRSQQISKELNLFLLEAGDVQMRRRDADDYDFENDPEIVHLNILDSASRSVVQSPSVTSKIYRMQSSLNVKHILTGSDSDSEGSFSDAEPVDFEDEDDIQESHKRVPLHSGKKKDDQDKEVLSIRERTLAKVRKEKQREISYFGSASNINEDEHVDNTSESMDGEEKKVKRIEEDLKRLNSIISEDVGFLRSNSIQNEQALLKHIEHSSMTRVEPNLTFASDDEETAT